MRVDGCYVCRRVVSVADTGRYATPTKPGHVEADGHRYTSVSS